MQSERRYYVQPNQELWMVGGEDERYWDVLYDPAPDEPNAEDRGRFVAMCLDGEAAKEIVALQALRTENDALKATITRQMVWATAGMHGKAEDDRINADKLVAYDELVARIEAENDALRAALREVLTTGVDSYPGWLAYVGDDSASCTYCGHYGGSPYDADDLAAWKHEDGCVIPRIAALVSSGEEA